MILPTAQTMLEIRSGNLRGLSGLTLTSNARPNHEKLFYNALIRFRAEQLENYPGVSLEYSASDYHHVARSVPMPAIKQLSASHSRNHNRRRSQFSIVSEEGGKRDSYYKDPVTAASTTTKESYDPYRSSRTPIVNSHADHATVVVRQGLGASRARKASHAASLRHPVVSRLQPQGHTSQHKGQSSSSGHSRSSLTSSRRSEAGMRKSVSYKRQVSFQHVRQRSLGNSLRTKDAIHVISLDTESSKGDNLKQELLESQSTPSLPTPPRIHRPRKPASDLDIKKSRAVSHYWKDEARKVSSELGKICEEAFNRSSVSSTMSRKNNESPATSVSTQEENPEVGLSSQLKNRPLPQLPAESLGSYTLRELAETRRRLLEHCPNGGSNGVPAYLTEVIAHLDRLMQPALKSESGGKRSASDPNPASAKNSSHLVAISEESCILNVSGEAQSSRSASDPLKSTKQVSFQNASKTIRLVSPEAPSHPQLKPIPPLNIRKKSLTPVNSLRAASTESLRNTMDRSGYDSRLYSGLDTIEEHPKSPKNKDPSENPGGNRKWSWFKRQSEPVDDLPPALPMKNSPPKPEMAPGLEASTSLPSSNASKAKTNSSEDTSETAEVVPTVEAKKKWFTKMFSKTNKNPAPPVAEHVIVQDVSSETDSNTASTENLLIEPHGQRLDKKTSKGAEQKSGEATITDTQPVQINQNWFAKFFHIRPASRIICLHVTKAKAKREVVKILKDWKKYGLRDVVTERRDGGDLIRGRVDSMNCKRCVVSVERAVLTTCQIFTLNQSISTRIFSPSLNEVEDAISA